MTGRKGPGPTIAVHVPDGAVTTGVMPLARRLQSLKGARIAILDNCKEFSDRVLAGVAERLLHEHGAAEVKMWRKGFPSKGAPFIAELARQCDAVVTGVGH